MPTPTPAPDAGDEDQEAARPNVTVELLDDMFDGNDGRPLLGKNACRILLRSLPGAEKIETKTGAMAWVAPPEAWDEITPQLIEAARGKQQRPAEEVRVLEAGQRAKELTTRVTEDEMKLKAKRLSVEDLRVERERLEEQAQVDALRRTQQQAPSGGLPPETVTLLAQQAAQIAEIRAQNQALLDRLNRTETQGAGSTSQDLMLAFIRASQEERSALTKLLIERVTAEPVKPPFQEALDFVRAINPAPDATVDRMLAMFERGRRLRQEPAGEDRMGNQGEAEPTDASLNPWWEREPWVTLIREGGATVLSYTRDPGFRRWALSWIPEEEPATPLQASAAAPTPESEAPAAPGPPQPPGPETRRAIEPWAVNARLKLSIISEAAPDQVEAECAALSQDLRTAKIDTAVILDMDPTHVLTNLASQFGESFADPKLRVGVVRFQAYERRRIAAEAKAEAPAGERGA